MSSSVYRMRCVKWVCLCVLTFRVFVQVCDVLAQVTAYSLSANAASHSFLLYVNLRESAIQVPLPVDLIAVHLENNADL